MRGASAALAPSNASETRRDDRAASSPMLPQGTSPVRSWRSWRCTRAGSGPGRRCPSAAKTTSSGTSTNRRAGPKRSRPSRGRNGALASHRSTAWHEPGLVCRAVFAGPVPCGAQGVSRTAPGQAYRKYKHWRSTQYLPNVCRSQLLFIASSAVQGARRLSVMEGGIFPSLSRCASPTLSLGPQSHNTCGFQLIDFLFPRDSPTPSILPPFP